MHSSWAGNGLGISPDLIYLFPMEPRSFLLPHEESAVNDFHQRLKDFLGERLFEIRLFGSKARGTDRPDSDVDVCVLLKGDDPDHATREAIYDAAWEGLNRYDVDISPLIFSESRFSNLLQRERLIAKTIQEEGIPL